MIRAACVLLACAAGSASARPDRAALEAGFRAHNPGHWTEIDADGNGVIRHVRSDDPAIVDADVPALRGIVQRMHADIGGRAGDREAVPFPGGQAFTLLDEAGTAVIGLAVVHRQPKQLDIDVQLATLTAADGEKRLAGRKVRQTIELGKVPPRDCTRDCRPIVTKTIHRDVTIERVEVTGVMAVHAEKSSARLVICVDAAHPAPDGATDAMLSNRLVSVPLVLDAVTGSELAVHARDCSELPR